jgi:hypothetical protein
MKTILISMICLFCLNSFGFAEPRPFHLTYKFEDRVIKMTYIGTDYSKAIEVGAEACMKSFEADTLNEQRYLDLIDACVNPH